MDHAKHVCVLNYKEDVLLDLKRFLVNRSGPSINTQLGRECLDQGDGLEQDVGHSGPHCFEQFLRGDLLDYTVFRLELLSNRARN